MLNQKYNGRRRPYRGKASSPPSNNIMNKKKILTLKQAKTLGEQLGIRWEKFDLEQFRAGFGAELEHGILNPTTNVTNDDPL